MRSKTTHLSIMIIILCNPFCLIHRVVTDMWRSAATSWKCLRDKCATTPPVEESHVIAIDTRINDCQLYLVLALPRESHCSWVPKPWVPVLVDSRKEGTCRGKECGSWRNRCIHVKKLSNKYPDRVEVGSSAYKPNLSAAKTPEYVNREFGRGVPYQSVDMINCGKDFSVKDKYRTTLYPSCVCSKYTSLGDTLSFSADFNSCKCGYVCNKCQCEWSDDNYSPARLVMLYHDSSVTGVLVEDRKCSSCGNCLLWDGTHEGIFCPTSATAITHKKLYSYLDQIINGGLTFEHMHAISKAEYNRHSSDFMDKVYKISQFLYFNYNLFNITHHY
jgi:hypothetical protein